MLMMTWILSICRGYKIGVYLSDISGAFDRVCKEYLLAKLNGMGIGADYLNFLDSYLSARRGQVVVEGTTSENFEIANSVFQGTVLGPPLWNAFFADVAQAASSAGGREEKFADDLSVCQVFNRGLDPEACVAGLEESRRKVHRWGRHNRVMFDAAKEHMVIIHPFHAQGDAFKLLGCLVDPKLLMKLAIEKILAQIRPKVTALLRTRAHYDVPTLIVQFKTHIWGILEAHNGAIFHAASSHLDKLDRVQDGFLRELGISDSEGFLEHNLAPPTLRRNIGILGLLHKRILGKSHPAFKQLLPRYFEDPDSAPPGRHDKQLYNHCHEVKAQCTLFGRSIFAMVDIYNSLPQEFVDVSSVSLFQQKLTAVARARCVNHFPKWRFTHDPRFRG